jgi:tetratricopeptide (TPR) repeat protein
MTRLYWTLPALLLLLLPITAGAQTEPATKPLTENQILAQQLADADPAVRNKAWDRVQQLLAAPPEVDAIGRPRPVVDTGWVRALTRTKRFDEAEKLALEGIARRPFDAVAVAAFARARTGNFRASGRHDAALAAAKSAYLVSGLNDSPLAADQLNTALLRLRPSDKPAAEAFKAQQADGVAAIADHLLKTITADAKPFEAMLAGVKGENYIAFMSRGNLLLLSDRVAEARQEFEKALDESRVEPQAMAAFDGVARAIRSEAGALAPARDYMREVLKHKTDP